MYIDLLKKCLLNLPYLSDEPDYRAEETLRRRLVGHDWPKTAHTMVGWKRLTNVEQCVETVLRDGVKGDLIEAGVWRGGCCILMQGILKARGEDGVRKVFVADSFCGIPKSDLPQDAGLVFLHDEPYLAVSMEQVKSNFAKYDLLGDNVVFIPGLFKDTLPLIDQSQRFAVIRLDGDLYQSTMDGLVNLYPKLSSGGYLISDDYYNIEASAAAINDYRLQHEITEDIVTIDEYGIFWRKR